MPSLKAARAAFPLCHRVAKASLSFSHLPNRSLLDAITKLIEPHFQDRPKRVSQPVGDDHNKVFMKIQRVKTLPKRLRVTLGRPKRSGRFDWPLEELMNTLIAAQRGMKTAQVVGFGMVKPRFGIVREFVLLTEYLDGHVNGLQWLRKHPQRTAEFISGCMNLLMDMHSRNLIHLDLWVANIMVPEAAEGAMRVIDMENVFTYPSRFNAQTLGLQLGFLYRKELSQFIDEASYDALVAGFLQQRPEVDAATFEPIYRACKHMALSHKTRRRIFLEGELDITPAQPSARA